jgi:hypothetical protein
MDPNTMKDVQEAQAEFNKERINAQQEQLEQDPDYQNAERITVKSGYAGTPDENRVAFSDPNTIHGATGAFVYGEDEFEVAVTPEVLDALRHGRLVSVDKEEQVESDVEEGSSEEDAKAKAASDTIAEITEKTAEKERKAKGKTNAQDNEPVSGQTKPSI